MMGVTDTVIAQSAASTVNATEVRKQFLADFDRAGQKFVALANAFPADKYSWRPAPGVRSVGEVFMHVASEFYVYGPLAFGAPASPVVANSDDALAKFEKGATKAGALKHLHDGLSYAKGTIEAVKPDAVGTVNWFGHKATIAESSTGMTADLHEHLGQLIAYARMNGITPPWSKP